MVERITIGYKRLFEVRLLHHYWLDAGGIDINYKDFTELPKAVQEKRLLSGYDVRRFLQIVPTATTEKNLQDLRCIFKSTALGFLIVAPNSIVLPDDAVFEFIITVQSADFYNYTAQTWQPRKIVEIRHEDTIYRYKENVPVLTNSNGVERVIGDSMLLLSKESPVAVGGTNYAVEDIVKQGTALYQAIEANTTTPPAPAWMKIVDDVNTRPVYVHQDDVPVVTTPIGSKIKGIELTNEIPDDVFMLVRIETLGLGHSHGLKDAGGFLAMPVFAVHFLNRSTIWKYYDKTTQVRKSIEPAPLPLTFWGNAGMKQKPSEGFVKYRKIKDPYETGYATAEFRLVSEIYE
jgi:hypothetical protein